MFKKYGNVFLFICISFVCISGDAYGLYRIYSEMHKKPYLINSASGVIKEILIGRKKGSEFVLQMDAISELHLSCQEPGRYESKTCYFEGVVRPNSEYVHVTWIKVPAGLTGYANRPLSIVSGDGRVFKLRETSPEQVYESTVKFLCNGIALGVLLVSVVGMILFFIEKMRRGGK